MRIDGGDLRRRKPNALHRSDRASQFSSEQLQKLLTDDGVSYNMSRSSNVWDNAVIKNFFSSLKTDLIARKVYRARDHAYADEFDYIKRFYNSPRRHPTIGYLSFMEFERTKASA